MRSLKSSAASVCETLWQICHRVPFLIILIAANAHAQLPDVSGECAPDVAGERRVVMTNQGAEGIWFHIEVARCMLGRVAALPEYAEHVRLLEARLSLSDERDALQARRVELAAQEAETATEALQAAVRARRRAEEDLAAWWRSPALWVAVGAVLGLAVVGLAAYAFGAISI